MNNLTELKTSELEGAALDWAVGRAAGVDFGPDSLQGTREVIIGGYQGRPRVHWAPTMYWAQLGPLIIAHRISLLDKGANGEKYMARASDSMGVHHHPTNPMVAACRAIACRHFGDTVGIPTYLLEA